MATNETVLQEGENGQGEFVPKPGVAKIVRGNTDVIPEVDVTQSDLYNDSRNPTSWLMYGGGYENQRFSPADVITPENVWSLELEWSADLSNIPFDVVGLGGHDLQGSPLIVPGDPPIMYFTQGPDVTRAINARTGDVLWTHMYESVVGYSYEVPANRGVAVFGDTVYQSTMDLGLVALDRFTGAEKWYYNGGYEYRGETASGDPQTAIHEELQFERDRGTASSFPPIIYEGTLMKGSFGGEWGVTGWIDGLTLDGERKWRFGTTPPDQWVGDSWKHGGGTSWQVCAVDPEEGTAVFPTANPGPWYGTVRPGWNQYTTGKVAISIDQGEYRWHYQESPHDWWDYDSPSPAFLFDTEIDGEERKLTSWSGKTGWVFTVDAESGVLHQRSKAFVDQINMWDLPPLGGRLRDADWIAPELSGGTDPQPPAFDPTSRTMILKGNNVPMRLAYESVPYEAGERYTGSVGPVFALAGQQIEGWNKMKGNITALDPVTGRIKWQDWFETNSPWGGALTTKTGLAFAGNHLGEFIAYDTQTGERLWQYELPDGVDGDPVTWYDPQTEKQYVAVGAGGSHIESRRGARLAVFSVSG